MTTQTFWVRLAGFPICLETKGHLLPAFFADYQITPALADFTQYARWREKSGFPGNTPLSVTEEEIWGEQKPGENYPPDYLESLAVYRRICSSLLWENVVLFHCSSIKIDDKAILFAAPSGTGKSTHVRLWKEKYKEQVTVINDDKPLLHITEKQGIFVYGSPYGGKDNLHCNTSAKAAAIVILHQAQTNSIHRISPKAAYPLLWNQTYRNSRDSRAMLRTMELVHKLSQLPVFSLGCTISEEAVEITYQALKGLEEK